MAVTYSNACKQARLEAVVTQIGSAGKLKLYTSGDALLATLSLVNPAGTASNDLLTLDFDPDISATASGSGTAAKATITNSSDTVIISGLTVGTSGADINLDSTSITAGQTVTITTGTITHAA